MVMKKKRVRESRTLIEMILFDFVKEMPVEWIKGSITMKDIRKAVDTFVKAHGLDQEDD